MKNKILYLILTYKIDSKNIEQHLDFQKKIVNYFKEQLSDTKITLKIIFTPKHIIENVLDEIDKFNDWVVWHPLTAFNNLTLLKTFRNSIVILPRKTVLIQKISINNPINENMAINNNFKLLYIDETNDDITNQDYVILGQEQDFLIKIDNLKNKIINGK